MNELAYGDIKKKYRVQGLRQETEAKRETAFSLSNGYLGLRGSHEEVPNWSRPEFYISGSYGVGSSELLGFHDPNHILVHPKRIEAKREINGLCISTLPNLPNPASVKLSVGENAFLFEDCAILSNERIIETDNCLVRRVLVFRDKAGRRTKVESTRFVSFACPNLICLKYTAIPIGHNADISVCGFINKDVSNTNGIVLWKEAESIENDLLNAISCIVNGSERILSIAQSSDIIQSDSSTSLELYIIAGEMNIHEAVEKSVEMKNLGFNECLKRHIEAYKNECTGAYVEFDGNPDTVQGFNFNQMHLQMAFGENCDKTGIPIKGLTGHGYRFANFWDMDFHMFPFYLLTKPHKAHKLLEYRYGQLDKYRENARKWGARGAQVPWETQISGEEVTAPWLCLQEREIHISADAAYMFKLYDDITGNHRIMREMGAEFIMETARFYASRVQWTNKRYELLDIGCVDQYHTFVDNSFFISLMAKWNIEYAAYLASNNEYETVMKKIGLEASEVKKWLDIIGKFHIIQPDSNGIIEEFEGYFSLSPDINGISETYCSHSQAVKQPDVLAAMVIFEKLYPIEIWRNNFKYYAERTLHGSSLSLPGMALAGARCNYTDEALYYLHKSARMDLDDVNMDTDRGIHVSSGAVEWQAVVLGFGGLTPSKDGLCMAPNLPRQWDRLDFTVYWQFQKVDFRITKNGVTVETDTSNKSAVPIRIASSEYTAINPGEKVIYSIKDGLYERI